MTTNIFILIMFAWGILCVLILLKIIFQIKGCYAGNLRFVGMLFLIIFSVKGL